jgi:hypothetical protein
LFILVLTTTKSIQFINKPVFLFWYFACCCFGFISKAATTKIVSLKKSKINIRFQYDMPWTFWKIWKVQILSYVLYHPNDFWFRNEFWNNVISKSIICRVWKTFFFSFRFWFFSVSFCFVSFFKPSAIFFVPFPFSNFFRFFSFLGPSRQTNCMTRMISRDYHFRYHSAYYIVYRFLPKAYTKLFLIKGCCFCCCCFQCNFPYLIVGIRAWFAGLIFFSFRFWIFSVLFRFVLQTLIIRVCFS